MGTVDCTRVATILMALQDGKLAENKGQSMEKFIKEYKPMDEADSDDQESSEDDDNEEDETPKKLVIPRAKFSPAYTETLFEDEELKPLLEDGIIPKREQFMRFIAKNPLPKGRTWMDLKYKFNTKIINNKKKASNKEKKENAAGD